MTFYKNFMFFLSLLRTSIRASISVRGVFLFESALLLVNNLIFLLMWWIFFREFKEIGGWTMKDMIALNAIGMGAYGLMQICFGGAKQIAKIILHGDLDPFMTQPKNLLLHLISSRSISKGWGHLLTFVFLIFLGGFTAPSVIALMILSVISGSLVFTSVIIMANSLVFWFGSIETVSKRYCDSFFLFALYPTNIYSGALQLVMFTLIPAGIIGYLPILILRSFSILKFILLLCSPLVFCLLATLVFYKGLKRYESGNQFGMRL